MIHANNTTIKIADNAPKLPVCFNAQKPETYKEAIDARVSALFKENQFKIIALAIALSPLFFITWPVGYATLRDIAKDQVDSALAHEKLKFLENNGNESDITQSKKYFTKDEEPKLSAMAAYLTNNKNSIYQAGKNTNEIWKDLLEKSKVNEEKETILKLNTQLSELKIQDKLKLEFNTKITKDYLNQSDNQTNAAINQKETTENNYAHMEPNEIPEDGNGKKVWPEHFPSPLGAITRDNAELSGYTITEFTDNDTIQDKTMIGKHNPSEKTTVTLKTFAEHCSELFTLTKKISEKHSLSTEQKQKLDDLIILSMTANYRSPIISAAANKALLSIDNIKDEDDKKIDFMIDGDSEKSYNIYVYDEEAGKLTISIDSEFGIKQSGSNDPVRAKIKQTSELVIDLKNMDSTPLWKTTNLSIM